MRGFTRTPGPRGPAFGSHLVFAWSPESYRLHERSGEPPPAGGELESDGDRLRVVRVGASPLPDDRRRCAFTVESADERRER